MAGGARAWSRRLEKSCLHAAAEGVTFGAALLSASVGAVAAKSKAIQMNAGAGHFAWGCFRYFGLCGYRSKK
ncbi:hypothetical protein CEE89_13080 [Lactobacillus crispatus]|nr:hypothetical protein CEE89_13080 [Lactobacillus crispatus]